MLHVYGIKNCDTVKKALQFLKQHQCHYLFHDLKNEPASHDKITKWNEKISIDSLLNTKGTTYRQLELSKIQLNDFEKIQWMAKHNLLIKRPVIENGEHIIIGFNLSEYERKLLS